MTGELPSFLFVKGENMVYRCLRNLGFDLVKDSIWTKEDYLDDNSFVRLSRNVNGSIENYCLEKNVFKQNFESVTERGINHVK